MDPSIIATLGIGWRPGRGTRKKMLRIEIKTEHSAEQSGSAHFFPGCCYTGALGKKHKVRHCLFLASFFPLLSPPSMYESGKHAGRGSHRRRSSSSSVKCSHSSFAYCFPILMLCPPSPPLTVLTLYYCVYNVRGSRVVREMRCCVQSERGGREKRRQREATRRPIVFSEPRFFSENENKVMVATAQPTFHLARSSFFFLSLQVLLSRNWDANERLQDSPPFPFRLFIPQFPLSLP